MLTFTRPEREGGAPITGYEVSTDGGQHWQPLTYVGTTLLTGTVTELTNGTTYAVKVRAVNALGGGTASTALSVTPATVPGAAKNVQAVALRTRVTVSWTAAATGGSPITGYRVTAKPGGQLCSTSTTSCVYAHLTPGVTYSFSVVAINTAAGKTGTGTGPVAVSKALRVSTLPGLPRALVVKPGDRALGLTFSPPTDNGGSAITSYQVSLDRGHTWRLLTTRGTSTLSATLAPELNGTAYAVAVRAVNGNGVGPATASVSVRLASWFRDPIKPADRAREIAVPKKPDSYRGPFRHTKATARAHDGTLAYPAALLKGRQLQRGQAVNLTGATLFAFDSAKLSAKGKAEIKAMSTSLRYVTAITCEGYADYAGRASHEQTLSKQRSEAVCALVKQYAPQVSSRVIKAYGPSWPVVVGGRAADRSENRHVVVEIR